MDLIDLITVIAVIFISFVALLVLVAVIVLFRFLSYRIEKFGVEEKVKEILKANRIVVSSKEATEICYALGIDPIFPKEDPRHGKYIRELRAVTTAAVALSSRGYKPTIFAAVWMPDGDYWSFRFGLMLNKIQNQTWVIWYQPKGKLHACPWSGFRGINQVISIYDTIKWHDVLECLKDSKPS